MKLITWNVNGLRAALRKGLSNFVEAESPDLLCLQEVKLSNEVVENFLELPGNLTGDFALAEKKGYSGVATYCSEQLRSKMSKTTIGFGESKFDREGRCLIHEHENFVLYNCYFPSGTTGELRQAYKFEFLEFLSKHFASLPSSTRQRLIICGDFNICHKEIDIHHPEKATKQAMSGFLPEERLWMDNLFQRDFIDCFRESKGEVNDIYSWWTYRAGARGKNLGWRIDYICAANQLRANLVSSTIHTEVLGSDHCPVSAIFSL